MRSAEIKDVFQKAGIAIPATLLDMIANEEYDNTESWCCGLMANSVDAGVLVRCYCVRGRGMPKRQWFAGGDGSWVELDPLPADWLSADAEEEIF